MKRIIINNFNEKIKKFIKNTNTNIHFNKNFILSNDYERLLKPYKLEVVNYLNLVEYVLKNIDKREVVIINNIDKDFSIKNKKINNIFLYKYFNKNIINKNFIIITEKNIHKISYNSILFF